MIDLSKISGLPLFLDEETGEVTYNQDVTCSNLLNITLQEIVPVLLNKYLKYPELIYRQFKDVIKVVDQNIISNLVSYSLVEIPSGLLGIEFIRTHIFHTPQLNGKYSCMVEIISGEVTLVLQKNADDDDEYAFNKRVEEVEIIKLVSGDRAAIPTGYFFTFINSGATKAIFAIVSSKSLDRIDYSQIQKDRGLAFYVISKNARLEVVANPKYKVLKSPVNKDWKDLSTEEKVKYVYSNHFPNGCPLYDFFRENVHKLEEALVY